MGRYAIVAYKPRDGLAAQTLAVVSKHHSVLLAHKLVTNRPAYIMSAANGVVVEVFEWRTRECIESAHQNDEIQQLWEEFAEVCEFMPLSALPECSNMFAEFDAV